MTVSAMASKRILEFGAGPDEVLNKAETLLLQLPDLQNIDEWIEVVRYSRHHNVMWKVNHVWPSDKLNQMNDLIRKSESILYENTTSTALKKSFQADINLQIIFNTIRAYLRAEEGNIDNSLIIWDDLRLNWFSKLSTIRKSSLLTHLCVIYLCCKKFDLALECFKKHQLLLQLTDYHAQYADGVWDNLVCLQLAQWLFMRHVPGYLEMSCKALNIPVDFLYRHKKIPMIDIIGSQPEWFLYLCSKPFYDHALSLMPELPNYNLQSLMQQQEFAGAKINNPYIRNYAKIVHHTFSTYQEQQLAKYELLWQTAWKQDDNYLDQSKSLVDYIKSSNLKFNSVVDLGCGMGNQTFTHFQNHLLFAVDFSNYVSMHRKLQQLPIIQQNAVKFMTELSQIDLCFCSHLIDELSFSEMYALMLLTSQKANIFAFSVTINENPLLSGTNEKIILENNFTVDGGVLHNKDYWIQQTSKYFINISSMQINNELLVYCWK